ncbi:hypothetical protein A3736_15295 [Erythrobacter sp. HI0063]|nr:hypothetical protein A3736_15295 [Erythrobacter sp. HI0063]
MDSAAKQTETEGQGADRLSEAWAALGELLAAASDMLDGIAILCRRGPTRARRFASTAIAFVLSALIFIVRSRARAGRQRDSALISALPQHLRHPPQTWAAP